MRILISLMFSAFLFVLNSCENTQEHRKAFNIIAGNTESGQLRGMSIGDEKEKVLALETLELIEDNDDELYYSAVLDAESESSFSVYYIFDQYGLFEIQVDVFPVDGAEVKELFDDFEKLFSERYGDGEKKGNAIIWSTYSRNNTHIDVRLSNESADYGKPFLSINFFEPMETEI